MKKDAFVGLLVTLLLMALFLCDVGSLGLRIAYASPYENISVGVAYDMITNGSFPDLIVLDVRYQSEYEEGHIYCAFWIPVGDLSARISELAGHENHEIIVYCKSGGRSATASGILDSNNFTKVYNMLGGISAWQVAGYPVWVSTIHNVNTTFDYDTIQSAIDAPQTLDGHTIFVETGVYYEHILVYKAISLVGENRYATVIDGNGTGNVMNITVNQVNITAITIRNGEDGIFVGNASLVSISENILTDNVQGITFFTCPCNPNRENAITENTIKSNDEYGIDLGAYNACIIYHNNFINNKLGHVKFPGINTVWDNGYPDGGNYWSDHNSADFYGGHYQNETGSDGIGDTSYTIGEGNADAYPLVYPFGHVPIPDINDDGTVNIVDIVIVAIAFGSRPGDPKWNAFADLNQDGIINIVDIVMVAIHFGE